MPASRISSIYSFLVRAIPHEQDAEIPDIKGASVAKKGKLSDMLGELYEKTDAECDLEIAFRHNEDGEQQNDCHDELIAFKNDPSIDTGLLIAQRLQKASTNRSRMGLLFLITGLCDAGEKIIVSRFPADSGILADELPNRLTVKFVEKIFLKNSRAYKTAVYTGDSDEMDFWSGKAIDRQRNDTLTSVSDYWVETFLCSTLTTTSVLGTQRFAQALNQAIRASKSLDVKSQLIASATIARGLARKTVSAKSICKRLALSEDATAEVRNQFRSEALFEDRFVVSKDILDETNAFRSEELHTGVIVTAETVNFENLIEKTPIARTGEIKYTTQGRLVDQRIQRNKK